MLEMIQDIKWASKYNPKIKVWVGLIVFGFIASLLGIAGMIYFGFVLGW